MTVGIDTPDYQSYANWRGPDLGASSNYPLSVSNPFEAGGYVTNYASLCVVIGEVGSSGATVLMEFWTDNTEAIMVAEWTWNISPGQGLNVSVPCPSNYAVIAVEATNAVPQNTPIAVIPSSSPTTAPVYFPPQNYVGNANYSAPANSDVLFVLPFVSAGNCYLWMQDPNSTGHLAGGLQQLTTAGVKQYTLAAYNVLSSFEALQMYVPAVPLAVRVINTDSAAHAMDYYCAVDGR